MLALMRYFGGKHMLARHLGPPRAPVVVEPFAGSAGYSSYWEPQKVILVEKDPMIAKIWRWLIEATPADIMDLPADATIIDDLRHLPEHVQYWIRMWFSLGSPGAPAHSFRPEIKGRRDAFWGENVRRRIAENVARCDHWEIIHGPYEAAPDLPDAHWHIDPPYCNQGKKYVQGSAAIDFAALAEWCLAKKIGDVCEGSGADWLPFEPLRTMNDQNGRDYEEMVYRLDRGIASGLLGRKE